MFRRAALVPPILSAGLLACLLIAPTALAQSKQAPRKGWFGVALKGASPEQQKALGLTRPVPRVERVFKGSPALNSGVAVGDYVVSLDGKDVLSVKDLVSRIGAKPPGTMINVVIQRLGEAKPVKKQVVLDLRMDMRERFKQEWLGRRMPAVTLDGARDSDGIIDLGGEASAGKVVVVDYFATWCGPCKRVMPELEQMHLDLKPHGVTVVGVSSEKADVVQKFLEDRPLVYPVGTDRDGKFSQQMMVSVLPTVWVVDKNGIIRNIFFGAGHEQQLLEAVRKAAGLAPVKPVDFSAPK
ncbi:MAG: thiol-disulfide isomerase/thioredoxin [Myxococcota bacterium]|jgi:thiol-disulfide isomerase/thioredoxin